MQSFKQYLLKEDSPFEFPWLVLELENKETFGEAMGVSSNSRYYNSFDNEVDKFVNGLKSHLGMKEIDWSFNRDDNLQVEIKLNNRHYVQDELEEIATEAMRYSNDELSGALTLDEVNPSVWFFGPVNPNVIIHYPVIVFELKRNKSISLSNFNKYFPDTQVFRIEHITGEVTNVLSLLKIKSLHSVLGKGRQWIQILNKYAKSHDVIGCQRELIENDLDEYAEF